MAKNAQKSTWRCDLILRLLFGGPSTAVVGPTKIATPPSKNANRQRCVCQRLRDCMYRGSRKGRAYANDGRRQAEPTRRGVAATVRLRLSRTY